MFYTFRYIRRVWYILTFGTIILREPLSTGKDLNIGYVTRYIDRLLICQQFENLRVICDDQNMINIFATKLNIIQNVLKILKTKT